MPFDEGIVTVASELTLKGSVPYRDFFIIMYPPGQIYVLAALYHFFDVSIFTGRMLAVFIQAFLMLAVFLLCLKITDNLKLSVVGWILALSCSGLRLGVVPSPIWSSMMFSLFGILFVISYAENKRFIFLLLAGILTSLAIMHRHDIGMFCYVSICCSLFLSHKKAKNILYYSLVSFFVPLVVLAYFAKHQAINDLINSLFLFPFVHEKTAFIAFPKPCFDLTMIFHGSLSFIKVNQFYVPILVYCFSAILLFAGFLNNKKFELKKYEALPILIFGVLTFNQARIRTDPAHLLTVIFPALVLFIYGIWFFSRIHINKILKFLYISFIGLISFLFLLIFVKNSDKIFKNIIKKPLRGDIILTAFERGGIYIPKEESGVVLDVVKHIRTKTSEDDRIYVGLLDHSVDSFGGNILLYTLSERMPSAKYYELAPGLVTSGYVQEEIIDSLKTHNVPLLILQKNTKENSLGKSMLDDYIGKNYYPSKRIGDYFIYEKDDISR